MKEVAPNLHVHVSRKGLGTKTTLLTPNPSTAVFVFRTGPSSLLDRTHLDTYFSKRATTATPLGILWSPRISSMSRPSLNGIVAFSMWRLKQRACLLLVACICLSEGVHAQQPSAAPNQQTLPQKPILGLMVTNPEGKCSHHCAVAVHCASVPSRLCALHRVMMFVLRGGRVMHLVAGMHHEARLKSTCCAETFLCAGFNDNALPLNITNPLILGMSSAQPQQCAHSLYCMVHPSLVRGPPSVKWPASGISDVALVWQCHLPACLSGALQAHIIPYFYGSHAAPISSPSWNRPFKSE